MQNETQDDQDEPTLTTLVGFFHVDCYSDSNMEVVVKGPMNGAERDMNSRTVGCPLF
jgi:hypothetical protein